MIVHKENLSNLALKDILGTTDLKNDARLASDSFWEQFGQPTQEEQMLAADLAKMATDTSDDEHDEADCEFIFCQMGNFQAERLDDEQIYERITPLLPFDLGKPVMMESLMSSSAFSDLLQTAERPGVARESLFDTAVDVLLATGNSQIQQCMVNCINGLIQAGSLSSVMDITAKLSNWLGRLGLDSSPGCIPTELHVWKPSRIPGAFQVPIPNLRHVLHITLNFLTHSIESGCEESEISPIFRLLLPLVFERSVTEARPEIDSILQKCAETVPVCMPERLLTWLQPFDEFLVRPVKRLCTLLRILSFSERTRLCWLPLLDHYLAFAGEESRTDEGFIVGLRDHLLAYNREEPGCTLTALCQTLELCSLRLMNTCIEDMPMDSLEALQKLMATTKDLIPHQPAVRNIRSIELLSKMIYHLEIYLRPLRRKAENSRITDHFKRKI